MLVIQFEGLLSEGRDFKAMRKAVLVLAVTLLSGCSTFSTPTYTYTSDVQKIDFSKDYKRAHDCETWLFQVLGPYGSSSVYRAAKRGNISNVKIVENYWNNFLLFRQSCTVVYGE